MTISTQGLEASAPALSRPRPFLVTAKKELSMLGVMVALACLTALLNPSFLSGDNLRNNVRHISLIALFALGEAVVIIAGGIDLSIGSVICVAAVATSWLSMVQGLDIGTAIAIATLLALFIGVAQGALSAYLGIQPFVVTLGSMLLLRGVAEVLTGGADIGFQGQFPGFRFLGEGTGFGLPMPFWFALVAILVTAFLMHRTLFGRYCYAIGSNAEAARLSGVPVRSAFACSPSSRVGCSRASRDPLRRLSPHGDTVARFGVRAPRRRRGGARRRFATGRPRHRFRCVDRSRAPSTHVQRGEPGRELALAERRGRRGDPRSGDRGSRLRRQGDPMKRIHRRAQSPTRSRAPSTAISCSRVVRASHSWFSSFRASRRVDTTPLPGLEN